MSKGMLRGLTRLANVYGRVACNPTVSHRPFAMVSEDVTKRGIGVFTPVSKLRKARRRRPLAMMMRENPNINATQVRAMALAECFDLPLFCEDEEINQLYQITYVDNDCEEAVHLIKKSEYRIRPGIHDYFVFNDGVLVAWDTEQSELDQVASCLKRYGISPYSDTLIIEEMESVPFEVTESGKTNIKGDTIYVNLKTGMSNYAELERYAFSQAIAASVKVGIWETQLLDYAGPLAESTKALSQGVVPWKRKETLQKTGKFAALRHSINLNCDLLSDDFYWERQELELYFTRLLKYFSVPARLRALNNRLDYCEELVKLIDNVLAHRHASHLEWMIIILIVIEVIFDTFHFLDKSPKLVYVVPTPTSSNEVQHSDDTV